MIESRQATKYSAEFLVGTNAGVQRGIRQGQAGVQDKRRGDIVALWRGAQEAKVFGNTCPGFLRPISIRDFVAQNGAQPGLLERRTGLGREVGDRVDGLEQGPH